MAKTTLLSNGTIVGTDGTTHASHVGHLFFDQNLIDHVELVQPYTRNTQPITLNKDDWFLQEEAKGMDPIVKYRLLGDS